METLKVGSKVRFNGGSPLTVVRVWTIDRGPDMGRAKACAVAHIDVAGYRGQGMSISAAVEDFEVVS